MNNNNAFGDLLFYVVVPLLIWNFGREYMSDYTAMILSAGIGIVYGLYSFRKQKKLNMFGAFILGDLIITMLLTVFSGSALQLLWNNVYYGYILGAIYICTVFFKKPVMLWLALDLFVPNSSNRQDIKEKFLERNMYRKFCYLTVIMGFKSILSALLQSYFINKYGVEAFDQGILIKQGVNIVFTIFFIVIITQILKGTNLLALLDDQQQKDKFDQSKE